jgi:hypothetical protein
MRFKTSTLLLVVTVLALWMGYKADRAQRQKRAVRWLEQNGGSVSFDWQFKEGQPDHTISSPDISPWLMRWMGPHYFQTPKSVTFPRSKSAEELDLAPLANLPGLESLD